MNNSKKLLILLGIIVAVFVVFAFFRWSPVGASLLWQASGGGKFLLPLVVISSLIDSINPCAFSVLLITVAFLWGIGRGRRDILIIGGSYIAGIFVIYLLIGFGLLQALHLFGTPHFMAKIGALLAIGLGLVGVVKHYFPALPIRLGIPHAAHAKMASLMERASLPAAFILGALVGLCEFPCTGGPYIMILGLLHDKATSLVGGGYLLLYNLIFILPLVIILLLAADPIIVGKLEEWKKKENNALHLWGGVAMVALGLAILAL